MATAEAETSQDEQVPPGGSVYDGFISYSHAADDLLAPRLQAGLQRFAKPWWKRRALRIFRDESSLSAKPHLWSSITDALDQSAWFVLLLSPEAAESPWVNNEVEYWLANKDADKIIPVLTDGDFTWYDDDFISDAAPPALQGAFSDEPRWVDLRFARTEEQLDLKNPTFSAAVADVASAIRGVPKDELESEEVLQHRRTTRTAWAAGIGLVVLLALSVAAAIFALDQQNDAEQLAASEAEARQEADANAAEADANAAEADRARQDAEQQARVATSEALAANAIAQLDVDPELSLLLAAEAVKIAPQPSALNAVHEALQDHRTIYQVRISSPSPGVIGAMNPGGTLIALFDIASSHLEVWEVGGDSALWAVTYPYEGWEVGSAAFTTDGTAVVVQLIPPFDFEQWPEDGPDALFVHDAHTGDQIDEVPIPDCSVIGFPVVHPLFWDLTKPIAWARLAGDCNDVGAADYGLLDPQTGAFTVLATGSDTVLHGVPTLSADGSLLAVGMGGTGQLIDTETGDVVFEFTGGISTLSRDGSRLLGRSDWTDESLELWDTTSGQLLWSFQETFSRAFFSPDETVVYGTSFDGATYILDAVTGAELIKLVGQTGRQVDVSMSADGARLATFSADGTARVWDIGSAMRSEGASYVLHDRPLHHQSQSADYGGGLIAVWGWDFEPLGWETTVIDEATGETLRTIAGGAPSIAPDGSLLAVWPILDEVLVEDETEGSTTGYRRLGAIQIVDPRTGNLLVTVEDMCDQLFDGAGDLRAAPECSGEVAGFVWDVELSHDATLVAMGSEAGLIQVWDTGTGATVAGPLDVGDNRAVAFSPDGERVAVSRAVDSLGAVTAYAMPDLEAVGEVSSQGAIIELVFSLDGTLLVGVDDRGALTYIDVATWEVTDVVAAHQGGGIRDVAISPSGHVVATVADDSFVRIWDAEDHTLITEVRLDVTTVRNVEFLDDSHVLVTSRIEPIGVVITLDHSELVDLARSRITRAPTVEECTTYGIDPCPTLEDIQSGSA